VSVQFSRFEYGTLSLYHALQNIGPMQLKYVLSKTFPLLFVFDLKVSLGCCGVCITLCSQFGRQWYLLAVAVPDFNQF